MLELLAPAGSMEAVAAAVQNGTDAVYLGYGDFNARRNAKNFSEEEFAAAVSYCHLRGAKVYLTLNTLLTDRELPKAAEVAAQASAIGADAVLIQMTLHNLDGVKMAADLGLTRAVLSRELSRDQIEYICQRAPIEIEVFAHGALCMCYSGQCFLSSVIGGRSGNRGLCAQPCRMRYGWNGRADGNPLSLTGIYARAIKEDREPTEEELEQLRAAFSRQGFTQGYYLDQQGPDMFGVREETREPKELFAAARNTYQSGEAQRVPVTFYAMLRPGEPARVGVEDPDGRVATVEGPVPEAARTRPLTAEAVTTQLSRTGGTPYRCGQVRALVEENLSLPLAALNALRREALEKLSVQRQEPPRRRAGEYHAGARYENRREEPVLTISVRRAEQLTDELLRLRPALVYVPLDELAAHLEKAVGTEHTSIGVSLPRVAWDREYPGLQEKLEQVRALGVKDALLGNLGMFPIARELGFTLRGDFGLEIYNAQALKEYKRLGLQSATLSFELKLAQIRDLSKCLDTELITYGRLPLMLMENCIIRNRTGSCGCQNTNILTDRKGARFPVVSAPGCRNELLNSQKLFLADRAADYRRIGLWAQRLLFTTENPRECVQVAQRYLEQGSWTPNEYTRGLYYRDVE